MKRATVLALVLTLAAGCSRPGEAPTQAAPAEPAASFVGRQACAGCHAAEVEAFTGSHHDRAMEEASAATVLGAFDGRTYTHFGVTSTFLRRGDRFVVRTEGPDGRLADFAVAYTFGVHPLQQYLVAFPGGRHQVLPLAWDARPAGEGGQRWFHLYPGEKVAAGDPLHWTGLQQNWNSRCAECHSTNLDKGYHAAEGGYQTTWSEIDVSCEACHGPASRHVDWARRRESRGPTAANAADAAGMGLLVPLRDPGRDSWTIDAATGNGVRRAPRAATAELATCGRCHSRRTAIASAATVVPGAPLLDGHRPVLLEENLYHADGQIDGEVYELGSFLQSRMHAAGVSCSDCHDPHTALLRRPLAGVCLSCHSAAKYDAPAHHFHRPGGAGSQCVDCHMPEKTYMGIDRRRDHSLRVPRPDLSVTQGTPNACNACHRERSARWAAAEAARRFGPPREPHYGEVIAAARAGEPGADAGLVALAADPKAPAIVRATALSLLGRRPAELAEPVVERSLADTDPLVRLGALRALEARPPAARLAAASPLLADPVRAVRLEAARLLAPAVGAGAPAPPAFDAALAEARSAEEVNAERPEALVNLAGLALDTGDLAAAQATLEKAVRLDPGFAPAAVNLADLLRRAGRDAEGEGTLRNGLAASPGDAALHHALGLLLVRQGRRGEALPELAAAAHLAPGVPRYAYVYGVALDSAGRGREARAVLAAAARRHPHDRDLAEALASLTASVSASEGR